MKKLILNQEQEAAYGRGLLEGAKSRGAHHIPDLPLVPSWHGVPDPRPGMIGGGALAPEEIDPRGPHEDGCTQDPMHTGQCGTGLPHEPVAKSAIEVPKPDKDEGEGMVIAHVEAISVRPGDRIRFAGYSGYRFVTVLAAHHRDGKRVDLTVRIPRNDAIPSLPYGDHAFTLEHNAVVERDSGPFTD